MGTVDGMIAQARALLGLGESPPGSNHNKVTEWYGVDAAWCDMSISYEAAHSDNLSAVMGKFSWTVAHAKAFQSHGRWHYGLSGARQGDVVFFDWDGSRDIDRIDHVGLVEATHSNNTITTLEGNTSDGFRRRVRNSACVVGYGRPAYGDAAPLPPTDGILRQGSKGEAVKALQRDLNTAMHSGLTVDGDFGSLTKAAVESFQRAHPPLDVDGEYGPRSAAMMKAVLAGHSQPVPPTPKPPPAGKLVVDGQFGPATCAALQRSLNAHGAHLVVDGSFGPLSRKALQHYLHVGEDGVIGPQTIKALQKHVGSAQDGDWGPDTTRHLQTTLNAGTF
jgi:peptidoglycan hydrolase-like protein with peptidoglycan-binding domain